jgi:hypothetical protein
MDRIVQNVIDSKDQMKFKVLLSSRIPAPRWGAIQVPRKEGVRKKDANLYDSGPIHAERHGEHQGLAKATGRR